MSANYPNANLKTIPIVEADTPSTVPVSSTTVSTTTTVLPATIANVPVTSEYTYPSGATWSPTTNTVLPSSTWPASTTSSSQSWTDTSVSSSSSTWSDSSAGYTQLPTEAPSTSVSSGSSMSASAPEWFPSSNLSSWTPSTSTSSLIDTETTPLLSTKEEVFIKLEESPSLSSTTEDINMLTTEKTTWQSASSFGSIPSAPPAPPVYHYPKSHIHPYIKYGGAFVQPLAFTILLKQEIPLWEQSLAAEIYEWAGEKVEGVKESTKSAVHATGEFLSELPQQATETAIQTGEYLGEKAVQAKETIVPAAQATGEYLGEKAVQAKETIVPAAQATGEYLGEKAVQAKETLIPAMQATSEYVVEKAHEIKEHIPSAIETAKETVKHTGEVLEEVAHSVLNWTEWTRLKAVALEQAAVETGKNLFEKAQETIVSTFHLLHPEGWVEGQIPNAPPAPAVYLYPLWNRRLTLFVRWGKGREHWAFTEIIKAEVPREEMGTVWAWGRRNEEFYDIPSGYWDTESFFETTTTTTTTTATLKEKERIPSFLGAGSPLVVRGK